MNYKGVIIGVAAFLIIGIFHPIIVEVEYRWGARMWPVFLVAGIVGVLMSLLTRNTVISACLGVLAFTCLWSIRELIVQEQRVERAWFPSNPAKQRPGFEGEATMVMVTLVAMLLLLSATFLWWKWRHRTGTAGESST